MKTHDLRIGRPITEVKTLQSIAELTSHYPHSGKLEWIGVRLERRADMQALGHVNVDENGLDGDRFSKSTATSSGKRAVTLIQSEHLPIIAGFLNRPTVEPALLRRNLAVSGINLLAMQRQSFRIGTAIFEGTGLCAPCSRMEEIFGIGGYNAVRGHGGICARVLEPGIIQLGDKVLPVSG